MKCSPGNSWCLEVVQSDFAFSKIIEFLSCTIMSAHRVLMADESPFRAPESWLSHLGPHRVESNYSAKWESFNEEN